MQNYHSLNHSTNSTKEHSINSSLALKLQFSKFSSSIASDISQNHFDKHDITIDFNRLASSLSDDLLAGNRLMATSNRV